MEPQSRNHPYPTFVPVHSVHGLVFSEFIFPPALSSPLASVWVVGCLFTEVTVAKGSVMASVPPSQLSYRKWALTDKLCGCKVEVSGSRPFFQAKKPLEQELHGNERRSRNAQSYGVCAHSVRNRILLQGEWCCMSKVKPIHTHTHTPHTAPKWWGHGAAVD